MLIPLSRRQRRIEAGAAILAMLAILASIVLAAARVAGGNDPPACRGLMNEPPALPGDVNEQKATGGERASASVRPEPAGPVYPRRPGPATRSRLGGGTPSVAVFIPKNIPCEGEDRQNPAAGSAREPRSRGTPLPSGAAGVGLPTPKCHDGGDNGTDRAAAVGSHLWKVTAYCPCRACCGAGARGVTASGARADHRLVAGPPEIPFGTVVRIPGYGTVRCEDRGSGVKGRRLDVLLPTHAEARAWGVKNLKCGVEKRRANHGEK